MKRNPHIFVCPLDWGIGHATRCVPLIRELLKQHVQVTVGADNRPLAFLKQEFPNLRFIQFPGYRFSYPENANMALKMAFQAPAILSGIRKERHLLDEIIQKNEVDGVISDNRFGLSSNKVPCVFMTHQLSIRVPQHLAFIRPFIDKINKHYISTFEECWIPDFEGESNLSGELSHLPGLPDNYFFIGPLSRFSNLPFESNSQDKNQDSFDILAILSGPEPQRSILEELLIKKLTEADSSAAVVSGKPENINSQRHQNRITIFPHLDTEKLNRLILASKLILSRPGYSTVMDLAVSGKKAVFIPTPGQTEQEYLARLYSERGWFCSMSQKSFNLKTAIHESGRFSGIKLDQSGELLSQRIKSFLNSL
jgi:uncharacterized protein (TIGR00661 family)